jgi:hypothetical protein
MDYYAGIDVSLESSSLCVVDATGRVVREAKIKPALQIEGRRQPGKDGGGWWG